MDLSAAELEKCRSLGLPFAKFVLQFDRSSATQFAPTIVLLLINVPVCMALLILARLCDPAQQASTQRERTAKLHHARVEHDLVDTRIEALQNRKNRISRELAAERRQSSSSRNTHNSVRGSSDSCVSTQINTNISVHSGDATLVDEALVRERIRLAKVACCIKKQERPAAAERMAEWLEPEHEEAYSHHTLALRSFVAGATITILVLISLVPLILAPMAILANAYCGGQWNSPNDSDEALWILYVLTTLTPAAAAGWAVCTAVVHRLTSADSQVQRRDAAAVEALLHRRRREEMEQDRWSLRRRFRIQVCGFRPWPVRGSANGQDNSGKVMSADEDEAVDNMRGLLVPAPAMWAAPGGADLAALGHMGIAGRSLV